MSEKKIGEESAYAVFESGIAVSKHHGAFAADHVQATAFGLAVGTAVAQQQKQHVAVGCKAARAGSL